MDTLPLLTVWCALLVPSGFGRADSPSVADVRLRLAFARLVMDRATTERLLGLPGPEFGVFTMNSGFTWMWRLEGYGRRKSSGSLGGGVVGASDMEDTPKEPGVVYPADRISATSSAGPRWK